MSETTGYVDLDEIKRQVEFVARASHMAPPVLFHPLCHVPPLPRIEQGGWTASVRRQVRCGPTLYTMRADYVAHDKHDTFFADGHPENKYPPTERPASPVELATFLEECQRYVAEREKA